MEYRGVIAISRKKYSRNFKGEELIKAVFHELKTAPRYAQRFQQVWLWKDCPEKDKLTRGRTGMDMVAINFEGDYWGIKCS